jgi:hypothetical protein
MYPRRPRIAVHAVLILLLSGAPGAWAETNLLQGTVQAEDLPEGCAVQATPGADVDPLEASGPRFSVVYEDGTFRFFDLPAGSWTLSVVTSTGLLLPPAEGEAPVVQIGTGTQEVSLAVASTPTEAPTAAAAPPEKEGSKAWIWATVGGVLGAVALAVILSGGSDEGQPCDPAASPSVPCQ